MLRVIRATANRLAASACAAGGHGKTAEGIQQDAGTLEEGSDGALRNMRRHIA